MQTISYTTLRQKLSDVMNIIEDNREIFHVTRRGHDSMVMMTESDFNAMQEMLYLLSNSNNAKRLSDSFAQAEKKQLIDVNWDGS